LLNIEENIKTKGLRYVRRVNA